MGSRRALFRNGQWEVTTSGIASLGTAAPCRLLIDAEDLIATDSFTGRWLYVWPLHVLERPWVNANLFVEAFKIAIEIHRERYSGKVDHELLDASFDKALENRRSPVRPRPPYRPVSFKRPSFPRRDKLVTYSLKWQTGAAGGKSS